MHFQQPLRIILFQLEEYGWEHCASFPNLRASVKRPHTITVSYFDEELEEVEKELSGFEARVFQHELDHLRGLHILNWQVSFGEVELIPEAKNDFPNFEKVNSAYKIEKDIAFYRLWQTIETHWQE